jgi:hypothetical protein
VFYLVDLLGIFFFLSLSPVFLSDELAVESLFFSSFLAAPYLSFEDFAFKLTKFNFLIDIFELSFLDETSFLLFSTAFDPFFYFYAKLFFSGYFLSFLSLFSYFFSFSSFGLFWFF